MVRLRMAALGIVAVLFLPAPGELLGGEVTPELERILSAAPPGGEAPVIVTFRGGAPLETLAGEEGRVSVSRLIRSLKREARARRRETVAVLREGGARGLRRLWIVNGVAFTATPALIRQVARRAEVERVREDATLEMPPDASAAPAGETWNLEAIRAPEVWALGHRGSGVVVAAMDTGVDPAHSALAGKERPGAFWYDPNGEHPEAHDSAGHGTQVMGLILGGDAAERRMGVAPEASWIAVKIYDDAGAARLSVIHAGFQWLLDPDGLPATDDAPDVVNNSWGYRELPGTCDWEFARDVEVLRAAGIAVVFSAGNGGPAPGTSTSPGNNPGSLAAGAADETNALADFSSRGPSACDESVFPELTAPGVGVRTADLTFGGVFPDATTYVTGTSFSAPHLSGALALLAGAFPDAVLRELEQALFDGALDLGEPGDDNGYGHGLIDLTASWEILEGLPPGPPCTDFDGDGFFVEEGCGTPLDCDDFAFAVHPGACDVRRDGIDQDCDGSDRRTGRKCGRPPGRGARAWRSPSGGGRGPSPLPAPGGAPPGRRNGGASP